MEKHISAKEVKLIKEEGMATIKRKRQTSALGLILEISGFFIFLGSVISVVGIPFALVGIVLMVAGFLKSFKLVCSVCGNRIDDKEVKLCPTCKESLLSG